MLLQSNGNTIEPLAAMPGSWSTGSYSGLVARGNFVVDCEWENTKMKKLTITANVGGLCKIRYPGIVNATVKDSSNTTVPAAAVGADLEITTTKGEVYTLELPC